MDVQVNWLAVALAGASTMVVGSIWYANGVFGQTWRKLVKLDEKKMKEGVATALTLTFAASLLTAYVLAHVTYLANQYFGNSFLQDALSTAFWVWLGFTATRFLTHDLFEHRPTKLTVLNALHELVTFMVMGGIIGLLKP